MSKNYIDFAKRCLILISIAAASLLLWRIDNLLLLVFGAILIAVMLRALSSPLEKYSPLSHRWALPATGIAIVIVLGLAGWLFGTVVNGQINDLHQKVPEAWSSFKDWLSSNAAGQYLLGHSKNFSFGSGITAGFSSVAFSFFNGLANLLLVIVGGIYLAAQPDMYVNGALKLVPKQSRGQAQEAMQLCGNALKLWLLGQLMSMTVVGVLIALGLWVIGVPSAAALGLLAGLGEFIPLFGAVLAIIPALLLSFSQGGDTIWWTLALFFTVQQIQGNVAMPLIQRYMVYLPPALTLFALVAFTMLFGMTGLLFAAPLTVVLFVLVKKFYIQETLGEKTEIPGA